MIRPIPALAAEVGQSLPQGGASSDAGTSATEVTTRTLFSMKGLPRPITLRHHPELGVDRNPDGKRGCMGSCDSTTETICA
jgi:hypothetical protein